MADAIVLAGNEDHRRIGDLGPVLRVVAYTTMNNNFFCLVKCVRKEKEVP